MKVLAICGSPRKRGNTEFALQKVMEGIKNKNEDAETEIILLRKAKLVLCGGCGICSTKGKCRHKDEMSKIHEKILKADITILATPNYFNNMAWLMKNFVDRTNPYWENLEYRGKKIALLVTGGQKKSSLKKCLANMEEFARIHRMKLLGSLMVTEVDGISDLKNNKLKTGKCIKFGEKLANKL